MALHKLEATSQVAPGYLKSHTVDGVPVVLACGEQGPVAVFDQCPHAGSPLGAGRVVGNRLRCPRHGYLFDLSTGECPRGPREGFGSLRILKLTEIDGHYAVDL